MIKNCSRKDAAEGLDSPRWPQNSITSSSWCGSLGFFGEGQGYLGFGFNRFKSDMLHVISWAWFYIMVAYGKVFYLVKENMFPMNSPKMMSLLGTADRFVF